MGALGTKYLLIKLESIRREFFWPQLNLYFKMYSMQCIFVSLFIKEIWLSVCMILLSMSMRSTSISRKAEAFHNLKLNFLD